MAPVSKKMMLSGVFMCLAAMAATMEIPVPQKTMSPFLISRAAMIAMSLECVIHNAPLLTFCPGRWHNRSWGRP